MLFSTVFFVVIYFITERFYEEKLDKKDSEIKKLEEDINNLEEFQDEILDLEEEIFNSWLEAVVKARQQKNSHDQSET